MDNYIELLVDYVAAAVRDTNAMFGMVFEGDPHSMRFTRGKPLAGEVREEAALTGYLKTIQELASKDMQCTENRWTALPNSADTEKSTRDLHVLIVRRDLDNGTCVAVVCHLASEHELTAVQHVVELAVAKWRQRVHELDPLNDALSVRWKRMFETCIQHERDAILLGGFAPFLRCENGLRAFDAPPITASELMDLVEVGMLSFIRVAEFPGIDFRHVRYKRSLFGVLRLGRPQCHAVVIFRQSNSTEYTVSRPSRDYNRAAHWIDNLKMMIDVEGRDAALISGSWPVAWDDRGIYPLPWRAIGSEDIATAADRIVAPDRRIRHSSGYEQFGVLVNRRRFRAAMFDYPSPTALLLMNTEERGGVKPQREATCELTDH